MRNKLLLPVMLGALALLLVGAVYAVSCGTEGAGCGMAAGGCGMASGGGCGMATGQCGEGGACPLMGAVTRTRALTAGEVSLAVAPSGEGAMVGVSVTTLSRQPDPNASVSVVAVGPDRGLDLKKRGNMFCGPADLSGATGLLVRVSRPGTSETVYFSLAGTGGCPHAAEGCPGGEACASGCDHQAVGACGAAGHCQMAAGGRCSMMDGGHCKVQGACKEAGAVCPHGGCGAGAACKHKASGPDFGACYGDGCGN